MGYFIKSILKLLALFLLVIINIPIGILDILSIYLFKRTLTSLILTASDVSVLADCDNIKNLDDEDFELRLNKYLLIAVKSALVFYITIALIVILIS